MTLADLFRDIANAIRSKNTGIDKMKPADFAQRIREIPQESNWVISQVRTLDPIKNFSELSPECNINIIEDEVDENDY